MAPMRDTKILAEVRVASPPKTLLAILSRYTLQKSKYPITTHLPNFYELIQGSFQGAHRGCIGI